MGEWRAGRTLRGARDGFLPGHVAQDVRSQQRSAPWCRPSWETRRVWGSSAQSGDQRGDDQGPAVHPGLSRGLQAGLSGGSTEGGDSLSRQEGKEEHDSSFP